MYCALYDGKMSLFDMIKLDNLEEFSKLSDKFTTIQLDEKKSDGYTLFILACKLHRYAIIKKLLQKNVDPFLVNNDGKTGLDILTDGPLNHDIVEIINYVFEDKSSEIKLIKEITTEPLKIMVIGEGTYGKVWSTNLPIVIKEYKINRNVLYNLMIELSTIRKINKYYDDVTPDIKKIKFTHGKYNVYFDKLKCTLDNIIRIYDDFETSEKIKIYKNIFSQLLMCIEKIHKIGILHCDLKSKNIMLNNDNKIRLIDFGLSHHFNYCPSIPARKNIISTQYVESLDSFTLTGFVENYDKKSYHSDIFSLGMIFFECITLNKLCSHHYINGKFYKYEKIKKNIYEIDYSTLKKMTDFSDDYVDLLKIMLNFHGTNRWLSSELLQHKFFGGIKSYENRYDSAMTLSLYGGSFRCTKYTDQIIKKKLYEMCYFENIHNAHINEYFDDIVELTNPNITNKFYMILADWLLAVMKKFNTDYIDIIINTLSLIYNFINHIEHKKFLQGYGIAFYYIILEMYWNGLNINDLIFVSANAYTNNEIDAFIQKICLNGVIELKSINLHITYITTKLEIIGIDTNDLYEYLCKKILLYVIFRHKIIIQKRTIWDIVQALFYGYYTNHTECNFEFLTMPNNDPFINELNELPIMNNYIRDVVKCDGFGEIEKLYRSTT